MAREDARQRVREGLSEVKTLAEAVKEAGEFIAAVEQGGGNHDQLDLTLLARWQYPVLTLGTLRALHSLGADITRCAGLFSGDELEQAIGGQH